MLRPGKFDITKAAVDCCRFNKNDKIMDIGCGRGDTVNYLKTEHCLDSIGVDISLSLIEAGKDKYPGLDLRFGDGESLEEFPSKTFDGIFMECVLSLINLPDEAVRGAHRLLKQGGKLIISDLCVRKPSAGLIRFLDSEAARQNELPHGEGDLKKLRQHFVDFRYDGKFLVEKLTAYLKSIGFKILCVEDRTKDLEEFVCELILHGDQIDNCFCSVKDKKNTGYFYLVAEKKGYGEKDF